MKVLVVDDKEDNRYLLETLFKAKGHMVVSAQDGRDALSKLKDSKFDVIISDVLMPNMDGFDLCRACKKDKDLRNIPFVFYSSVYTSRNDQEFAQSIGADRYLEKPMEPQDLLRVIEDLAREKKAPTEKVRKVPSAKRYLKGHTNRIAETLEKKIQALELANARLEREIKTRQKAEEALRIRSRDEIFGFLAAAIPVFGNMVSNSAKDALIIQFSNKFEETMKPKYLDYLKEKGRLEDLGSQGKETPKERMLPYLAWLTDFFLNLGIKMRYDMSSDGADLEILSCPWEAEGKKSPIYCQLCRAMIYRSHHWAGISGTVSQQTSKANQSKSCLFKMTY